MCVRVRAGCQECRREHTRACEGAQHHCSVRLGGEIHTMRTVAHRNGTCECHVRLKYRQVPVRNAQAVSTPRTRAKNKSLRRSLCNTPGTPSTSAPQKSTANRSVCLMSDAVEKHAWPRHMLATAKTELGRTGAEASQAICSAVVHKRPFPNLQ